MRSRTFPVLGKRLGKRMKEFGARIQQLTRDQIESLQETGSITIDDETFGTDEITDPARSEARNERAVESLHLDRPGQRRSTTTSSPKGIAREVVNRIQRSRKEMNLNVSDRIACLRRRRTGDGGDPPVLADYIAGETLATRLEPGDPGANGAFSDARSDEVTRSAIESKWRGEMGSRGKEKGRYCGLSCADLSARSLSISPSS